MFIKVFRKKFSSALLLGSMVFTIANGASVYAGSDENAAKEVLAAGDEDVGDENGGNGIAANLVGESPVDENAANETGDSKEDNKTACIDSKDSSKSSNNFANKALVGGASVAVSAPPLMAVSYLSGKAKNKGGSNSGSSKSSNSGTTDGNTNTGVVNNGDSEDLKTKLTETEKLLENTKKESASSVSWAETLFGFWGLLHNKKNIGKGRVMTTAIIHGIFIILGIIQIVLAKMKCENAFAEKILCSSGVIKMLCPGVGFVFDSVVLSIVAVNAQPN